MTSSFSLKSTLDKKESLGFSRDSKFLGCIQVSSKNEYILGAFSSLINKRYVVSFEENGLLFMGIDWLNEFNNKDKFLSLDEIGNITYKKSLWINGKLIFNGERLMINSTIGKSSEYILYTSALVPSWIKGNIESIHKRIDSYPTLKDKTVPNVDKDNISKFDDLLKLKELLDQGILTQEEFDKEKAKIIN